MNLNNYSNKELKKIIMLLLCFLLIIILGLWSIYFILNGKYESFIFIRKFNNNKNIFENSVNELIDDKDIYFKNNGDIMAIVYEQDNDSTLKQHELSKSELSKYSSTIELMEKLNLNSISKSDNNVVYYFSSPFVWSKEIVYVNDLEKFKYSGHLIKKIKHLNKNWYYIENE